MVQLDFMDFQWIYWDLKWEYSGGIMTIVGLS